MSEAQQRISSREFERWRAFAIIDPWWLPERLDAAVALLCSVVFNTARTKKTPARGADKFFPDYERRARKLLRMIVPAAPAPADDLRLKFRALTVQKGGSIG